MIERNGGALIVSTAGGAASTFTRAMQSPARQLSLSAVDLRRVHVEAQHARRPDGEQAFWIDGSLQGHWKEINWRKTGQLKANALTLESYVTDSWTKNPMNVVFFDNVVIARRYIGPAAKLE